MYAQIFNVILHSSRYHVYENSFDCAFQAYLPIRQQAKGLPYRESNLHIGILVKQITTVIAPIHIKTTYGPDLTTQS